MSRPIITLTTDFGTNDSYVAQMKGTILTVNPDARIIDITHNVPPQSIIRAAYLVAEASGTFPPHAIHVVVVDPGVGSSRRIVGAEIGEQQFIAPDNGVLGVVATQSKVGRVVKLLNTKFWRSPVSETFHGRDIMAPVAAHWSTGIDLESFGEITSTPLCKLDEMPVTKSVSEISGQVLWIDSFGNIVTNIDRDTVSDRELQSMTLSVGGHEIQRFVRYYAEADGERPLAIWGSNDRLEIAIANGNAAERLRVQAGDVVTLLPKPTKAS